MKKKENPIIVLFLGPPGCGKGTQSKKLCQHLDLCHISTGDILRKLDQTDPEMSKIIKSYTDIGQFIPDSMMLSILEKELEENVSPHGYVFDGFPRTANQIVIFDALMRKERFKNASFVYVFFRLPEKELIDRLLVRSKKEGRSDDTPDVIKKRLRIYKQLTAPVIVHYQKKEEFVVLDGKGKNEEETWDLLLSKLALA